MSDNAPKWSPNGKEIVFVGVVNNTAANPRTGIYVMDANGSEEHNLTPGALKGDEPEFSPDGKKLVFMGVNAKGYLNRLFIMNANGTHTHALTDGGSPDWQPR